MRVFEMDEAPKSESSDPIFTGTVSIQDLVTGGESKDLDIGLVHFGPGVHTKLHVHESDQVILGTAGKGIYATEHEQREAKAGTMVLFPQGERHWHGARLILLADFHTASGKDNGSRVTVA